MLITLDGDSVNKGVCRVGSTDSSVVVYLFISSMEDNEGVFSMDEDEEENISDAVYDDVKKPTVSRTSLTWDSRGTRSASERVCNSLETADEALGWNRPGATELNGDKLDITAGGTELEEKRSEVSVWLTELDTRRSKGTARLTELNSFTSSKLMAGLYESD